MIYRIEVWMGTLPVGEMICEIAPGKDPRGSFRYLPEYLQAPDAFALDPVSLLLQGGTFSCGPPGIFSVFDDSLPDDWGRRLLIRKQGLLRHQINPATLLLALGNSGLGALSYSEQGRPQPAPASVSTLQLEELGREAERFESGAVTDDAEVRLLLGAGSSPGGARPKALVFDEENNAHCLAKFPSIKDQVDVVRIEAATMSLASQAGLVVPDTCLVECGGRPVLLVQRFDITAGGRRHMISFQTLLKARGYYVCRYAELLQIVRKISADPAEDSHRLYRQMVFNAVVNNTDDHLKNFWMLCDAEKGWHLSPSFDLVPNISGSSEHVLFFEHDPLYPGRATLERLGKSWGIPRAEIIVEEVFSAVTTWREGFARFGVPEENLDRFAEIDGLLKR
jgi:serine/threonine-protein kinase HipA